MSKIKTALASAFLACIAVSGFAAEPLQQQNSNALWFENWIGLSNATLRVTGPGGTKSEIFVQQGTPVYQLPTRDVADGVYRYELTAATEETANIVNPVNNGRGDAGRDKESVAFTMSGHFTVSRGVIIRPENIEEGALGQDN